MDTNLAEVYENSVYVVRNIIYDGIQTSGLDLVLKINQYNERIIPVLKQFSCDRAVFITAWNPRSMILSDEDNIERNNQLESILLSKELKYYKGAGQDPNNIWPSEESFFVLGLDDCLTQSLCNEFQQNAVVIIDLSGIPKLGWYI